MCLSSPKIPDPIKPYTPPVKDVEPMEFQQEKPDDLRKKALGTRRLQIPLGGVNPSQSTLGGV